MSNTQESLDVALAKIFESLLADIHTVMPGLVQSYNPAENTIAVQPCLMRKFANSPAPEPLPIIEDVPILMLGAGDFWITIEPIPGSYVLLLMSERSIENFMQSGGIADPQDTRKFDLSDAIAIPGIIPLPNVLPVPPEPGLLAIRNKLNTINFKLETDKITATVISTILELTATGIEATAPTFKVNGNIEATGNIEAGALVRGGTLAAPVTLNTHVHAGVTPGTGSTASPTPGT